MMVRVEPQRKQEPHMKQNFHCVLSCPVIPCSFNDFTDPLKTSPNDTLPALTATFKRQQVPAVAVLS